MSNEKISVKNFKKNKVEHYNAILIENLHSRMDLVFEKLDSMEEHFDLRLKTLKSETDNRFDVVEFVLRQHSSSIKNLESRFDGLDSKVEGLDSRVGELGSNVSELSSKVEGLGSNVSDLNSKMEGMNRNLNKVVDIVSKLE